MWHDLLKGLAHGVPHLLNFYRVISSENKEATSDSKLLGSSKLHDLICYFR